MFHRYWGVYASRLRHSESNSALDQDRAYFIPPVEFFRNRMNAPAWGASSFTGVLTAPEAEIELYGRLTRLGTLSAVRR